MLKIGIFCSSSNDIAPVYYEQTACLGEWIGKQKHAIVYGGTTQGLMECIAQNVKREGGKTIGILPQIMYENRLGSPFLDQLIITKDLTERKDKMVEIADVFVALPGGFGTLDEIFHVVAGGQVGYHNKPVLLFNQNNFYQSLIQQIEQMSLERFTSVKCRSRIVVVNTTDECINELLLIK
jgi:uncharacterized protein (TIGR00730 family)